MQCSCICLKHSLSKSRAVDSVVWIEDTEDWSPAAVLKVFLAQQKRDVDDPDRRTNLILEFRRYTNTKSACNLGALWATIFSDLKGNMPVLPEHAAHLQALDTLRAHFACLPVVPIAMQHYSMPQMRTLATQLVASASTAAGVLEEEAGSLERFVLRRLGVCNTMGLLGDGTPSRGAMLNTSMCTVSTIHALIEEGRGASVASDYMTSGAAEDAVDLSVEIASQPAHNKSKRVRKSLKVVQPRAGGNTVERIAESASNVTAARPLTALALQLSGQNLGMASALNRSEARGNAVRKRGGAYKIAHSSSRTRSARLGLMELLPPE